MKPAANGWAVCVCGHYAGGHVRGTGRCRLDDPFGEPCDCRKFEADEPDDDPREED